MVLDTFSGVTVTLPDFPVRANDFDNFVIFHYGRDYVLFLFNNKIVRQEYDTSRTLLFGDNGNSGLVYTFNTLWDTSWQISGFYYSGYSLGVSYNAICSSSVFSCYKDTLTSSTFSIDLSEVQTVSYTLRPIVEEQNITPIDIFGEIFGILPVLIVVLVGFIGIRKGIKFLFELLRSS